MFNILSGIHNVITSTSFSQADEFFQIRRLYTILGSSIFYKVWIIINSASPFIHVYTNLYILWFEYLFLYNFLKLGYR